MSRPRPADRASSSLVTRASAGPLATYQPFIQRPATSLTVTLAGQEVTSAEELTNYLNGLDPARVVFAFRDIQDQIQVNAEYLQDVAADVWDLAGSYESMRARRARDTAAYEQEFGVLINAHRQSTHRRHRLQEGHDRLTRTWMTSTFFNTVVLAQTNGSTAIMDALNAASSHHSPGQIIARASSFRLQRLAGIGPYRYATADVTITPADIRNAFEPGQRTSIHPQREQAAANQHNLLPDQRGVHWIGGVAPPGINDAYHNAGQPPTPSARLQSPVYTLPSSSAGVPSGSLQPRLQSPRSPSLPSPPPPRTPQNRASSPSIQPSIETDPTRPSNLRPQASQSYAGMQGKSTKSPPAGSKRRRDPASPDHQSPPRARSEPALGVKGPKGAQIELGPKPSDILGMISGLRTLTVSPTRTPLVSSRVKAVKIPVQQPTSLDSAIWSHVLRKAQAIAERRQPSQLTAQQQESIAGAVKSLPNLEASIQRLTTGVQNVLRTDDSNLQCYLEGLADMSSVAFSAYNYDRYTVGGVREVAARLNRAVDGGTARIGDGNEYDQGFTITPADFDTLIRDERHTGWLNSPVLMAALLVIVRAAPGNESAFVLHVDQVLQYRQHQITANQLRMPTTARNLVIPFHWGNHWTVGLVDVATRQIRHMDSYQSPDRQRDAIAVMHQLLAARQDIYGTGNWTVGTLRSGQQVNSDDCGLWVIENTRRLVDDLDYNTPVGPATRRYIAEELYLNLINDTPPLPRQTRREAEVARARQAIDHAAGPGRTQSQPLTIRSTVTPTPGPDMPHIANATRLPRQPSPAPGGASGTAFGPRLRQGSHSPGGN